MNLNPKKGITLIVLVITIIIVIILAGAIISNLNVSSDSANLSNFANNVSQIQDYARTMYIMENKLPVANDALKMTKENIISLVNAKKQDAFRQELASNGESQNVYFYKIDMEKALVDKKDTGYEKNGQDDVYVISLNSLKVYYLRGVEYDSNMYFSLNSNIASIVNLPLTNEDLSTVTVNTFQAVTVSKSNQGYSKDLGIQIIANMDLQESLRFSYNGIDEKQLLLPEGQTVLKINNITDFNRYLDSSLSASEISAFNNLSGNNRVITLTKYVDGNSVGSTVIDISNYDNFVPTLNITQTKSYDEFFMVNGIATDNDGIASSGIAYVKYELLDRLSATSSVDANEQYMLNNANSVSTDENGAFSLKVPKDVVNMKIAAIDKVGNIVIKSVTLQ